MGASFKWEVFSQDICVQGPCEKRIPCSEVAASPIMFACSKPSESLTRDPFSRLAAHVDQGQHHTHTHVSHSSAGLLIDLRSWVRKQAREAAISMLSVLM